MIAWLSMLALPAAVHASPWTALPSHPATPPLYADSRETTSSVLLRSGSPSLEAAVGDRLGLVRYHRSRPETPDLCVQVDLGAALFLGFTPYEELTFAMTTVDGLLRLPVTVRYGDLSTSLEWAHVSAHYADGVRVAGEELPEDRDPWSRESLRLLLAWEHPLFRPYGGGRLLVHSVPEAPAPGLQVGYHLRGPWTWAPYHALDVRWQADREWRGAWAAQVGLLWRGGTARTLRLALAGRTGPDDTGKTATTTDRYLGFVVAFGRRPAPWPPRAAPPAPPLSPPPAPPEVPPVPGGAG